MRVLELERGRVDDDGRNVLRSAVCVVEVEILAWLAAERHGWPRWLNAYDLSSATMDRAVDLGCEVISAEWHAIDEESVGRAACRSRRQRLDRAAGRPTKRLASLGSRAICAEFVRARMADPTARPPGLARPDVIAATEATTRIAPAGWEGLEPLAR